MSMTENFYQELINRAKAGDAQAQYELGKVYSDSDDYNNHSKAFGWYEQAANQGHSDAKTALRSIYGVFSDDDTEYYQYVINEAEAGNADAQFKLGRMNLKGEYVPQDYKKAFEWLLKAADQGYKYAQYELGKMYFKGEGVSKDYEKAVEWYRKAANQGHEEAQGELDRIYEYGEAYLKVIKKL